MKHIAFMLALVAGLTWSASAQKTAGNPVFPGQTGQNAWQKAVPDTLYHNFFAFDPVLYTAPLGGWMNGTNGFGDVEKGQETALEQGQI